MSEKTGTLIPSLEMLGGIVAGALLALLPMNAPFYVGLSLIVLLIVAHMGWRIGTRIGGGVRSKIALTAIFAIVIGTVLYCGWSARFPSPAKASLSVTAPPAPKPQAIVAAPPPFSASPSKRPVALIKLAHVPAAASSAQNPPAQAQPHSIGIYVAPDAVGSDNERDRISGMDTGVEDHGRGTTTRDTDISGPAAPSPSPAPHKLQAAADPNECPAGQALLTLGHGVTVSHSRFVTNGHPGLTAICETTRAAACDNSIEGGKPLAPLKAAGSVKDTRLPDQPCGAAQSSKGDIPIVFSYINFGAPKQVQPPSEPDNVAVSTPK
jgi:hypothetical protein